MVFSCTGKPAILFPKQDVQEHWKLVLFRLHEYTSICGSLLGRGAMNVLNHESFRSTLDSVTFSDWNPHLKLPGIVLVGFSHDISTALMAIAASTQIACIPVQHLDILCVVDGEDSNTNRDVTITCTYVVVGLGVQIVQLELV